MCSGEKIGTNDVMTLLQDPLCYNQLPQPFRIDFSRTTLINLLALPIAEIL